MYKKVLTILLIIAFGAARPEMGWSDGCRAAYQVKNAGEAYLHYADKKKKVFGDNPVLGISAVHTLSLRLCGYKFLIKNIDNHLKHAAWYGRRHILLDNDRATRDKKLYDKIEKERFLTDLFCNNIVFPVVDCAVGRVVDKSGIVAEESSSYKKFAVNNGRLVVAAGVTRAIKLSVTQTTGVINTQNAKQFAGDVVMQVGSNAIEEFVINPLAEDLCGAHSASCQAMKCVGNGVAVYAMCEFVNYMVGK